MDRFVALRVFCKVVEEGNFAAAAQQTGMSRSAISKNVRELEEHLGTTLVRRTTRAVSLTEAGSRYYERVSRLLQELQAADDAAGANDAMPTGVLRLAAPMSLGLLYISPVIAAFHAAYPQLTVDMALNDAKVNLLQGDFDLAIRGSRELEDSSIIARSLGETDHVICAAPAYFARAGRPDHPDGLRAHDCLVYTGSQQSDRWRFQRDETDVIVPVRGPFRCNNSLALRQAALDGLGLVRIPEIYVAPDLAAGRLERVLADWPTQKLGIWIMYPDAPFVPNRLRVFIRFLVSRLGGLKPVAEGAPAVC